MKLTPRQREVLEELNPSGTFVTAKWGGWFTGARIFFSGGGSRRVHLNTVAALRNRNLLECVSHDLRDGDRYRISAAGRAALASQEARK